MKLYTKLFTTLTLLILFFGCSQDGLLLPSSSSGFNFSIAGDVEVMVQPLGQLLDLSFESELPISALTIEASLGDGENLWPLESVIDTSEFENSLGVELPPLAPGWYDFQLTVAADDFENQNINILLALYEEVEESAHVEVYPRVIHPGYDAIGVIHSTSHVHRYGLWYLEDRLIGQGPVDQAMGRAFTAPGSFGTYELKAVFLPFEPPSGVNGVLSPLTYSLTFEVQPEGSSFSPGVSYTPMEEGLYWDFEGTHQPWVMNDATDVPQREPLFDDPYWGFVANRDGGYRIGPGDDVQSLTGELEDLDGQVLSLRFRGGAESLGQLFSLDGLTLNPVKIELHTFVFPGGLEYPLDQDGENTVSIHFNRQSGGDLIASYILDGALVTTQVLEDPRGPTGYSLVKIEEGSVDIFEAQSAMISSDYSTVVELSADTTDLSESLLIPEFTYLPIANSPGQFSLLALEQSLVWSSIDGAEVEAIYLEDTQGPISLVPNTLYYDSAQPGFALFLSPTSPPEIAFRLDGVVPAQLVTFSPLGQEGSGL